MTARNEAPGRGTTWRPLTKREKGRTPFCGATGLALGDCNQRHLQGSRYCYYHDKRANGAIDFCMAPAYTVTTVRGSEGESAALEMSSWAEVPNGQVYPVHPLPRSGYALLGVAEAAA